LETRTRSAADLTREGLEHYGRGDTSAAIQAWKQALECDPEDPAASDYMATADRRKSERNEPNSPAQAIAWQLAREAGELMRAGNFENALNLLRGALEANPGRLELEASLELARANLLARYRARLGSLDGLPVPCAAPEALTAYNLPADAGFLISLMDGKTCLTDLVSVSGMDHFDALHALQGLLDAGLVELR